MEGEEESDLTDLTDPTSLRASVRSELELGSSQSLADSHWVCGSLWLVGVLEVGREWEGEGGG